MLSVPERRWPTYLIAPFLGIAICLFVVWASYHDAKARKRFVDGLTGPGVVVAFSTTSPESLRRQVDQAEAAFLLMLGVAAVGLPLCVWSAYRGYRNAQGEARTATVHFQELPGSILLERGRRKVLLGLLACFALLPGSILMIARDDLIIRVVGLAGVIMFGGIAGQFVRQLKNGNSRVIINNEGILDDNLGIGLIPWSDIQGAQFAFPFGESNGMIQLSLRNTDIHLSKLSPIRRLLVLWGVSFGQSLDKMWGIHLGHATSDPKGILRLICCRIIEEAEKVKMLEESATEHDTLQPPMLSENLKRKRGELRRSLIGFLAVLIMSWAASTAIHERIKTDEFYLRLANEGLLETRDLHGNESSRRWTTKDGRSVIVGSPEYLAELEQDRARFRRLNHAPEALVVLAFLWTAVIWRRIYREVWA